MREKEKKERREVGVGRVGRREGGSGGRGGGQQAWANMAFRAMFAHNYRPWTDSENQTGSGNPEATRARFVPLNVISES